MKQTALGTRSPDKLYVFGIMDSFEGIRLSRREIRTSKLPEKPRPLQVFHHTRYALGPFWMKLARIVL
jgi:hypothetical protein